MTSELVKNRYRIIGELGEGGFGKTYLAEDTQMPSSRRCVIKLLKAMNDNPQVYQMVQERFQREAALLEDLGEYNDRIPRLYAYFVEHEQFYLVEEWIQGLTLTDKLKKDGILNEATVRNILLNILPVLEYIQSKGIIHRDIKPDNIILRSSDNQPVLIDFGAVKETMATIMTNSGRSTRTIVVGTPGFMPSEQCAGRPVFSSDLYSLGLTAIYLLTGRYPQNIDTDQYTGQILWRQYVPNLSADFAGILDKTVQPNARDRYLNAKAMRDAIQSIDSNIPTNIQYPPQNNPDSYNSASYNNSGNSKYNPPVVDRNSYTNTDNSNPNNSSVPNTLITQPNGSGNPHPNPNYNQGGYQSYPPSQNPAAYNNPNYSVPREPYYSPSQNQYNPSQMMGGGGTFNTSVPIPPEINGWNWGAFLMSPWWSIGNQVWIGLISFVPYAGLPMPFILGAKGNAWAWRSRQWKSIEAFKAHQRAWVKWSLILYGVFFALITLGVIAGSLVETKNDNGSSGKSTTQEETQPQNLNPTIPQPNSDSQSSEDEPPAVSPQEPTPQSNDPSINTPPQVKIGENVETVTEPNAFIDGYWKLDFNFGGVQHQSTLYMQGKNGTMRTQYSDSGTNQPQIVDQTMRLWSSSQGLIVKGYNPVDANTKQTHPTYQPDEFLFRKNADGSLFVDNCSGSACSNVTATYLGQNPEGK